MLEDFEFSEGEPDKERKLRDLSHQVEASMTVSQRNRKDLFDPN